MMVVMVVMCRMRYQARVRQRIRREANSIEWIRLSFRVFVWVVVVVMIRVVMMVVRRLSAFVSALRQAGCHATIVDFSFASVDLLSGPPILLSTSSKFRSSSLLMFVTSRTIAFRIPRWGKSGGRGCAVCVLPWRGSRTPHSTSKAGEHSPELALDAWVVASRSHMLRLRSLDSLR